MRMIQQQIADCRDCVQYNERSARLLEALDAAIELADPAKKRALKDIILDVTPEQGEELLGRGKQRPCPWLEIEVTDVEMAKRLFTEVLKTKFKPSSRYSERSGVRFWDAIWQGEIISVFS